MSAQARVRIAVELNLEAGGAADALAVARALAENLRETYVVTGGGRWAVTDVEFESAAVTRQGGRS